MQGVGQLELRLHEQVESDCVRSMIGSEALAALRLQMAEAIAAVAIVRDDAEDEAREATSDDR